MFDGEISEFVRSDYYGAQKILSFYQNWYINKELPKQFLFITYEDLHANTEKVLEQVLKFIGIDEPDKNFIKDAIEMSSFENLKKAEKDNKFNNEILAPADQKEPENYKVRKGKVNNYYEYLSEEDIQYIDKQLEIYANPFVS